MDSLHLNIHSVLKIEAKSPGEKVRAFLLTQLGHFSCSKCHDGQPDIEIERIDKMAQGGEVSGLWYDLYGFSISKFMGRDAVVFKHKGDWDIIVTMGSPVKIHYRERPGIHRKLYSVLLYCMNLALGKRNGALIHGAVLKKVDHTVLLAGHRGTMKTLMVLSMMHRGWDFISDDKCLLHHGTVYLFQPTIPVRLHHVDALPWLNANTAPSVNLNVLRRWCAGAASKLLPGRLVQSLNRFLNPSKTIRADRLFPDTQVLNQGQLSDIVILNTAQVLKYDAMDAATAIEKLSLVQELANAEFAPVSHMLKLKTGHFIADSRTLWEQNLENQKFYQLSYPSNCNINRVYQELTGCLQQP